VRGRSRHRRVIFAESGIRSLRRDHAYREPPRGLLHRSPGRPHAEIFLSAACGEPEADEDFVEIRTILRCADLPQRFEPLVIPRRVETAGSQLSTNGNRRCHWHWGERLQGIARNAGIWRCLRPRSVPPTSRPAYRFLRRNRCDAGCTSHPQAVIAPKRTRCDGGVDSGRA